MARGASPTSSAGPRCGTTRCSSTARTRSPTTSSPFIDAAPREEQKYFLTTQQVDEARHAVFFKRFMHEVVGRGDGTIAGGAARRPSRELTWGFRKTFELLDRDDRRAAPRPLARQARARGDDVPRRRRGDARPARPALHRRLPGATATCCPASARACATSRWTSSATSASASSCCATSRPRTPRCRDAVADLLREVTPVLARACSSRRAGTAATPSASASRSRRSTSEGARSFEAKLRAAGLPLESLPGPADLPAGPAAARARRARPGDAARRLPRREATAPPPRDPEAMALLFDSRRAAPSTPAPRPTGPFTVQWEFPDAEPWHLRVDNGSTAAAPGRAPERRPRAALPLRRLGRRRRPAASTRAARSPPGGCARAARRARCGAARGLFAR